MGISVSTLAQVCVLTIQRLVMDPKTGEVGRGGKSNKNEVECKGGMDPRVFYSTLGAHSFMGVNTFLLRNRESMGDPLGEI